MNRRRFIKTGLIFVPSVTKAQSVIFRRNPAFTPAAATPCDTQVVSTEGSFDDQMSLGYYTFIGNQFTASESSTICRVDLRLNRFGTPAAGTLKVEIWTDNSGDPGTKISESSTVDRTTIASGVNYQTFEGLSASLTSSSVYWVMLEQSSGDGNFVTTWIITSSSVQRRGSLDGSSWDNLGGATQNYKLFK